MSVTRLQDLETKSDKGNPHSYLEVYEMLFDVDSIAWFAEIGVQNGHSIKLWEQRFVQGTNIYGFDINLRHLGHRPHGYSTFLFEGDAYEVGSKPHGVLASHSWDVLIDDGSHELDDMMFVCEHYASNTELLIIEDVPSANWVYDLTQALPGDLQRYSYMIDRSALGYSSFEDDRLFVVDQRTR